MSADDFNPYQAPHADLSEPDDYIDPESLRPVPFEDTGAEPRFWHRVWAMFSILFQNPKGLADRIPVTNRISSPWLFTVLLGLPGYLLMTLIMVFFVAIGLFAGSHGKASDAPPTWFMAAFPLFFLVLGPLIQGAVMLMGGLVVHGCLWLWGGLKQGRDLNATLRATGYSMGYFTLIGWIPFVGSVATLLAPAALGYALSRIHRMETWRGICAAYTPALLCCCAYGIFLAAMMMFGALAN